MPRLRGLVPGGAGGASAGPGEEDPELGEDVLAVRLRAKARGGPAPANRDEIRRLVQVDLNAEKNLRDLEDPQLAEHMRQRRGEREAYEASRAALPRRGDLRREDTAGRRALSALTTQLKEQQMALQCASDEVHAHATNAGKLAAGAQPHGYPATAPLEHLQKKLLAAADALGGIVAALEGFERDLALARRHYEAVVDGLGQWCEHYEGGPHPGGPDFA